MASSLGDLIYAFSSTVWKRLAGNTTATRQFLSQTGTGAVSSAPAWAQVTDADLSTSNITTNNVTIAKHGFAPILPNDATKFLDGTGAYSTPAGAGNVTTGVTLTSGKTIIGAGTSAIAVSTLTATVVKSSSGTESAATAGTDYVAPGAITTSGLTQATARLLGRSTAATGAVEEISVGTGLTLSAGSLTASGSGGTVTTTGSPASGNLSKFSGATSITNADLTGDVTTSGTVGTTIANSAVTLAKIANAAGNAKLVGSGSSGSGASYSEISLGTGLSMVSTTLTVTGTFSGALIGFTAYAAGADAALHTQSSNTMTDVDATNATVTFTAPASGNVFVRASCLADNSTSGDHYYGLRESTTTVATGFALGQATQAVANRTTLAFYLTGVSAGSHTYKLAERATAGTVHTYSGPNYGQVVLEVYGMP